MWDQKILPPSQPAEVPGPTFLFFARSSLLIRVLSLMSQNQGWVGRITQGVGSCPKVMSGYNLTNDKLPYDRSGPSPISPHLSLCSTQPQPQPAQVVSRARVPFLPSRRSPLSPLIQIVTSVNWASLARLDRRNSNKRRFLLRKVQSCLAAILLLAAFLTLISNLLF